MDREQEARLERSAHKNALEIAHELEGEDPSVQILLLAARIAVLEAVIEVVVKPYFGLKEEPL